MTKDEQYLYIQGAQSEFELLCKKIVHDGRHPDIVACVMVDKLAKYMRQIQELWDTAGEITERGMR